MSANTDSGLMMDMNSLSVVVTAASRPVPRIDDETVAIHALDARAVRALGVVAVELTNAFETIACSSSVHSGPVGSPRTTSLGGEAETNSAMAHANNATGCGARRGDSAGVTMREPGRMYVKLERLLDCAEVLLHHAQLLQMATGEPPSTPTAGADDRDPVRWLTDAAADLARHWAVSSIVVSPSPCSSSSSSSSQHASTAASSGSSAYATWIDLVAQVRAELL
jgi:hypothetical protein